MAATPRRVCATIRNGMETAGARLARGDVLIVDDDERIHELVAGYFQPHWRVHAAYNSWQAFDAIDSVNNLRLALVDLNLPGSNYADRDNPKGGFEVIRLAKRRFPHALVSAFTAYVSSWTVNTSAKLGAEILGKEDFDANLQMLVRRLFAFDHADRPTADAIMVLARAHRLTGRQIEVVALAANNYDRVETAECLGISLSTVKTHISNILRQCEVGSIDQIRRQVLRRERKLTKLRSPCGANS